MKYDFFVANFKIFLCHNFLLLLEKNGYLGKNKGFTHVKIIPYGGRGRTSPSQEYDLCELYAD